MEFRPVKENNPTYEVGAEVEAAKHRKAELRELQNQSTGEQFKKSAGLTEVIVRKPIKKNR